MRTRLHELSQVLTIAILLMAAAPVAYALCVGCAGSSACVATSSGGDSCVVVCNYPKPCKCSTTGACFTPAPKPQIPVVLLDGL